MSNVRIELNLAGINEMMKSPEIQASLQAAGEAVAASASAASGEEYGVRTHLASWVAITNIYPDSAAAAADNLDNNTLLKAVGAVGLPTAKGG